MSRPLWRYAHYESEFFFEGSRYAGRQDRLRSARYYHSAAGAEFAARRGYERGDNSDYERYSQVEKLQPGKVWDHYANAWVDGLAYQPWSPHRHEPVQDPADDFDSIPF